MAKGPLLAIKEIGDLLLRRNFQAIKDYFDKNSQLEDFVHLEIEVTKNQDSFKIKHGLGIAPKDVIVTRLIAPSAAKLVLNHGKFDSESIDVTVTGLTTDESMKFRIFLGTFVGTSNAVALKESDTQEIKH